MTTQGQRRIWPIIAAGVIVLAALVAVVVGIVLAKSSQPTAMRADPSPGLQSVPASEAAPSASPLASPVASLPEPAVVSESPTPEVSAPPSPVNPAVILVPINAALRNVSAMVDFTEAYGRDVSLPVAPAAGLTTVSGDEPGWFAGTKDQKELTCDRSRLADTLEAQPDKARAWGEFVGIGARDVREFVMTLTPVVLRTDTAVDVRGLADGIVTGFPAVLQAGTAVLADDRGVPTVRCFGNNPLTPPAVRVTTDAMVGGDPWPEWDPTNVVEVAAAIDPFSAFRLVDIRTGRLFDRPVGIHGTQDTWAP